MPLPRKHFGRRPATWHGRCDFAGHPYPNMNFPADPTLRHQLPLVARIIRDETWLEAERRGHTVPADDPVVRANVCAVILRTGAAMRASFLRQIAAEVTTCTAVRHLTVRQAA
jgi:hypothetical protein